MGRFYFGIQFFCTVNSEMTYLATNIAFFSYWRIFCFFTSDIFFVLDVLDPVTPNLHCNSAVHNNPNPSFFVAQKR
eukprot:UN08965